jgi:alanyl-tRNA synthetase
VIEIWNNVFMQYNRKANGELELLPNKNVDTGMGFERLCMALQGKQSNYDTDVFTGMISKIEELSGHKYGVTTEEDVAMRVIADHIRAISFSIADGQLPSNVKAGYVIRRILRRAVRYGYTFLGFNEPFICRLVQQLVDDMGEFYPEIVKQQTLIERVIKEEEMAFLRTLDRGIRLMDNIMAKSSETKIISGEDAFVLYDTFGFPIDLSELIASEKGYKIDLEGFQTELQKQKDRARNATAIESGDWVEFAHCDNIEFLGYDYTELEGVQLTRHRTVKAKNKTMYQLVFERTPFYAEMGGQVGDTGYILSESGEKINIVNTIKENNLTIHVAERIPADCTESFSLHVDTERRKQIENNHTATHLLHQALREILGTHVEQKGSYVCDKYFRFDFSHFEKLTDEQIDAVEKRVNALIRANYPLDENRNATMEEAQEMGAMALFGEKYGDKVRVVKFGQSCELCGGTHAAATGQIGFFKITAESAIAAGVRRIEATTGVYAEIIVDGMETSLRIAKAFFNNAPDLAAAIQKMVEENEAYKKQMDEIVKEKTITLKNSFKEVAKEQNGIKLVVVDYSMDPAMLKNAAFMLQKETEKFAIVAAFEFAGKPQLLVMYSEDLVKGGKNAGADVREAAKLIMGGGGGQPGLATAGGKDLGGLSAAITRLVELATA